jgi:8-oxo-dGTP diphosphatase
VRPVANHRTTYLMKSGDDKPKGPFLAVRAIILDQHRRVLLLRRAAGTTGPGAWCLPGGKVDFGQTVEEAMRREVHEETGLTCDSTRFLFFQDSLPGPHLPLHFLNLYFECSTSGQVTLNEESSDFRWISASEIGSLAITFRNDEGLVRYWALAGDTSR